MSAVQPFDAWYFVAADDAGEVEQAYAKFGTDDEGWQRWPAESDSVMTVRVIAVEEDIGRQVWIVREGNIERVPSWMVRDANINKPIYTDLVRTS
jgi:hypothetical protein